jgi:hypothetical protein
MGILKISSWEIGQPFAGVCTKNLRLVVVPLHNFIITKLQLGLVTM